MYDLVEFPSCDVTLRGRMYRGVNNQRPCVVMAHGTSATISMVADSYAEAIHDAGFSVLLYDHANFGGSDGDTFFGQFEDATNAYVRARFHY